MNTEGKDPVREMKWYERPITVYLAILAIGPLAIPLVWRSPAFKPWVKWTITILLIFLTLWFIKASASLYQTLLSDLTTLQNVLKQ